MPSNTLQACVRRPLSSHRPNLSKKAQCLDHNTFSGDYKAGLLVVEAAEAFKGRRLNDSEYQKAAILGWVVIFVSLSAHQSVSPFILVRPTNFAI